jgi:hypothetical protein
MDISTTRITTISASEEISDFPNMRDNIQTTWDKNAPYEALHYPYILDLLNLCIIPLIRLITIVKSA